MLLEAYRPLTYGLPMAVYRCPTPTLTVQTDQRGETRRKPGDQGAQRPDSAMGACSARPSARGAGARGHQPWRLPGTQAGRRGREARWGRDIRAEADHPRGWGSL